MDEAERKLYNEKIRKQEEMNCFLKEKYDFIKDQYTLLSNQNYELTKTFSQGMKREQDKNLMTIRTVKEIVLIFSVVFGLMIIVVAALIITFLKFW